MRSRIIFANLLTYGLAFLPVFILVAEAPGVLGFGSFFTALTSLGKVSALAGIGLFSVNVLLSSRNRFLDRFYGGLDTLYLVHHDKGKLAYVLLLLHPSFLAVRLAEESLMSVLLFLLPSDSVAVNLGKVTLILMSGLILVTLFVRLEYQRLKRLHQSLGAVLVVGAVHSFLTGTDVASLPFLRAYVLGLVAAASLAYVNTTLLGNPLSKKHLYTVEDVRLRSDTVTEVDLKPSGERLGYEPGQFVFTVFSQEGLRERHPFSPTSDPGEELLSFAVKQVGDYTGRLRMLEKGTGVSVEGPYGGFTVSEGGRRQIWVAGGIGVTPFMAMARSIQGGELEVDLYHSYRDPGDVFLADEMEELFSRIEGCRFFRVDTRVQGRLDAAYVKENSGGLEGKSVYVCGPERMNRDLARQFRANGVPAGMVFVEFFKLLQ